MKKFIFKAIMSLAFSYYLILGSLHICAQENQNNHNTSKNFDGLYGGISVGSQNIFGGSLVDGVDILAQDSRFVTEFYAGFRKQFLKNRFLAGLEFQLGFLNANLTHSEPNRPLFITYKNNFQSGLGLTMGVLLDKSRNFLLFLYGNETTRQFKVQITNGFGSFRQQDEQGMLKYGLGIEAHLLKQMNIRATIGRLRVDFGEKITNIDVEDKIDLMLGVVFQL